MEVIDSAVPVDQIGRAGWYPPEVEEYIAREVDRMLYVPLLPNGGDPERKIIKQLRVMARHSDSSMQLRALCRQYARKFEDMLPKQEYVKREDGYLTLPGRYYIRKPLTAKADKGLFKELHALAKQSREKKDWNFKWLAEQLLAGPPEPVSNFRLECRYLLRGGMDGKVTRLVKLVNILGEESEGPETGGTHALPSEPFASAEKFRSWCLSVGNFNWGVGKSAGNIELQMLHTDIARESAYRVVEKVESVGWHEIGEPDPVGPGETAVRKGLWFYDECAIAPNGEFILPDDDGVIWHDGKGYAFARRGREAEFTHGRPQMHPANTIADFGLDTSEWPDQMPENLLGGFFRETCRRFYETIGGLDSWMAMGVMLQYPAAPEIFAIRKHLPGLFMPGEMGSGKTTVASWLISLCGYMIDQGLGLTSRNTTPVGIMCQLENYSNSPLWLDEFRQHEVGDEKLAILRDAYNRQLAAKWSPDGQQRRIRTTPIVTGETSTSDAATRSRYVHVQLSKERRMEDHTAWFSEHRRFLFIFTRELLRQREKFTRLVQEHIESWMTDPALMDVAARDRATHAPSYAAFMATAELFDSHAPGELKAFRNFMIKHASSSSKDVQADINANVFWRELITAYSQDAVSLDFFRLESEVQAHPPGAPNQGPWNSFTLYFQPDNVIAAVQSSMAKRRCTLSLRQKDLQDQLSKHPYWARHGKARGISKRFGPPGATATSTAWGVVLDLHPLGYQPVKDEEFEDARAGAPLTPGAFVDGDPRKGSLYTIVDALLKRHKAET